MVLTRTIIIIGAGLAIAAGAAYFMYQNLSSDTLSGQLAHSRLGIDKLPSVLNPNQKEADYSKPLSQQPKDWLANFLEEQY